MKGWIERDEAKMLDGTRNVVRGLRREKRKERKRKKNGEAEEGRNFVAQGR